MPAVSARPAIPLNQDVYSLACERMEYIFDNFDKVVIAFSGGKDSTAVLNVALEVAHSHPRHKRHLPLRLVHCDEECIPYQTEEYVRRVYRRDDVTLEWYCMPFQLRNACSRRHPSWWTWAPESRDLWARPMPPEAITELPGFSIWPVEARLSWPDSNRLLTHPTAGNVAWLMGIRAQESLTRRRAVSMTGTRDKNYLIHIGNGALQGASDGNVWKAYPIYDWRTEDVWTAPKVKGWDYNTAYDLQEMAGLSAAAQRCSPAFGEEPIQKLHIYAQCFPELWEKMTARVPGVGAAYRYARTELYGFGSRPQKPAGMPWPEFITRYLRKHDPEGGRIAARRLRTFITIHYHQTQDPILPKAIHPETGVSWDFILMVAMRGDFKERKQPKHALSRDPAWRITHWTKYAEELTAVIAAGTFPELAHPRSAPADPYALIPPQYRQETDS